MNRETRQKVCVTSMVLSILAVVASTHAVVTSYIAAKRLKDHQLQLREQARVGIWVPRDGTMERPFCSLDDAVTNKANGGQVFIEPCGEDYASWLLKQEPDTSTWL